MVFFIMKTFAKSPLLLKYKKTQIVKENETVTTIRGTHIL